MESVILQHLSIGYTAKSRQHVVARGLSASIQSGELTCLLGRNGVGKSTLLRTLSAFQPALQGDILYRTGQEESLLLSSLSDKQLSRLIGLTRWWQWGVRLIRASGEC